MKNWLENVRNRPTEKKIQLMWIILGIAAVVLIIIWALAGGIKKDLPKDTRLFDTIGRGIRNLQTHPVRDFNINSINVNAPQ